MAPNDSSNPVAPPLVVNDFSIHVATANGSGSQSANNVLIRAIFQMGVPVSGKNLFPSNIQGEPTWFTIRVSEQGFLARRADVDVLVAMNPRTAQADLAELKSGAVCISPAGLGLDKVRADVTHYQVPFAELASQSTDNAKLRKLLVNMVYVGVLGELFGLDFAELEKAIHRQFEGKGKAIDSNLVALNNGRQWTRTNLTKSDPYIVRALAGEASRTAGQILIDGNSAAALGAMFAGVSVVAWYPITPSSSLCESLSDYLAAHRVDKSTGKASFAVVQAEDELAAAGMVLGAGWAGARAMTATSGPGISLMAEFAGLGYFAEIPAVIFDIQRTGPSTGMPTRTSQADISFVYSLSHGDTRHIVLFPSTVEECYTMAQDAFQLADLFQTPVFVLSDLDLGMNLFMSPRFAYPTAPLHRGKILTAEDLTRLGTFGRYRDVDGDGIPYRTLPGTEHPLAAYFTRGSGHNENAGYSEKPGDYVANMNRLSRKHETARQHVPAPVVDTVSGAEVAVIAFGSSDSAVQEARHQLGLVGVRTSYLRLRGLPFATAAVRRFVRKHKRVYVVEQNRDGQMAALLRQELPASYVGKLRSVLHFDGLPIHARFVTDSILKQEGKSHGSI